MAIIPGINTRQFEDLFVLGGEKINEDFLLNLTEAIRNEVQASSSQIIQELILPTGKGPLFPSLTSPGIEKDSSVYLNPYLLSIYLMEWFREGAGTSLPTSVLDALADDLSNADTLLTEFYGASGEFQKRIKILYGNVPTGFILGRSGTGNGVSKIFAATIIATNVGGNSAGEKVTNLYATNINGDTINGDTINGDTINGDSVIINGITYNGQVGPGQLAPNAVDTDNLINLKVTTEKIANGAFTSDKISAGYTPRPFAIAVQEEAELGTFSVTGIKISFLGGLVSGVRPLLNDNNFIVCDIDLHYRWGVDGSQMASVHGRYVHLLNGYVEFHGSRSDGTVLTNSSTDIGNELILRDALQGHLGEAITGNVPFTFHVSRGYYKNTNSGDDNAQTDLTLENVRLDWLQSSTDISESNNSYPINID